MTNKEYIDSLSEDERYDELEDDLESGNVYPINPEEQEKLREDLCCHSYRDMEMLSGGMIQIRPENTNAFFSRLEQDHGPTGGHDWECWNPFNYYIIGDPWFIQTHTNEYLFFYAELEVWIWVDMNGHYDDADCCPDLSGD